MSTLWLGHEGLAPLRASLQSPLELLILSDNGIGSRDISAFASMEVKELQLRQNQIDAVSLEALLKGPLASSLTALSMSKNPIGDDGARVLANAGLGAITRLWLNETGIGDDGARALLTGPRLATVVTLGLAKNRITSAIVPTLEDPSRASALTEIALASNLLDPSAVERLVQSPLLASVELPNISQQTSPQQAAIATPRFDVLLASVGDSRLAVTRLVAQTVTVDLAKAMEIVSSLPVTLASAIERAPADALCKSFEALGARVEVRKK